MRRPFLRIPLFCALVVFGTAAGAMGCDRVEYAQLKDDAATPSGKIELRMEYCMAASDLKYAASQPAEAACREKMQKISTALQTAGDSAGALWAAKGCKGAAPDAGKWPGQK